MKCISRLLVYFVVCSVSMPAFTDVNINGFATIAFGKRLGDDPTPPGYNIGYDDSFSFEQDSLFGLQATAILDDGLEAVVQIKSDGAEDWETSFEWAFISYKMNDNFKFILGRQRIPYYAYSDYVDVGYAYHWVSAPAGLYNNPFNSIDGLSILLTNSFGGWDSTFQLLFGRDSSTLPLAGGDGVYVDEQFQVKDNLSVGWTMVRDWLTIRAGRTQNTLDLTIEGVDALAAGWAQVAPGVAALAPFFGDSVLQVSENMASVPAAIQVIEDDAIFSNFGVIIDYEPFIFAAEWSSLDLDDTLFGTAESVYVSAGYRFAGEFLIHLTHGWDEGEPPQGVLDGIPTDLTGGPSPELAELDAGINNLLLFTDLALEANYEDSNYTTLGFRWDFHPSAAAKVEYTQYSDDYFSGTDSSVLRFAVTTVF